MAQALPVGGDRWAVIGRTGLGSSHMISVYNGDGTMAWEQISQYSTGQGYGDVVQLPDSGMLHVGAFDGCDYIGHQSRVTRYDANGIVLWEKTIDPQTPELVTMAAKGSNSLVAVASRDSVRIMDMDGNMAGGYQALNPDIQMILWVSDSSLLIVRGTNLHLVDIAGAELALISIGSTVVDMQWNGQDLFVLANDSIRHFSAGLVPLGNSAMPDMDANSRFIVSESGLFVHIAVGLYQLDADGTPTLLFPWPALPNFSNTSCAVRGGTVFSVGNTNISGRRTGIIRTLSMNGDAVQHDQDVEVLLQVDSTWTDYVGGFYPYNRHADITGYVVNRGSDTLHSVVLSMWVNVPYLDCNQPVNRIDTTGFALAPGDTLSLPFGAVYVELGLQTAQAIGAGDICIVALAPDHIADRAPGDNTACATVDFSLGVEGLIRNSSLSLAPNPAINVCELAGFEVLGTVVHVSVMDLTGRVVLERLNTTSANNMQLDISGLPPATYILSAEGERSRAMVKLVVTHP